MKSKTHQSLPLLKWLHKSVHAHLTWLHRLIFWKRRKLSSVSSCKVWVFDQAHFTNCFPSRLCSCALDAHDVMCIFPLSNVNLNRLPHFREQLSLNQSAVSSGQGLVWCRLECRWQNAPRKLPFASGHLCVCAHECVRNIFYEERCLNINPVYHFKLHFTTALSIPLNWNGWIASSERSH